MAKRIVLLSDGTGNSAAKLFKTNIYRLHHTLDLQRADQCAVYDDGVGTERFKPLALLGGAMGLGLSRNVLDLYAFLCRNYRDGDQVYAFGFSRGAFTIRTLIGLICEQGVARAHSEHELRKLVALAYKRHRRHFRTHWASVRDAILGPPAKTERLGPVPEIAFVGLWDTVAAYGLPVDELQRGIDRYFYAMTFPDRKLSHVVKRACHVLALDDERRTFHPMLWNEAGETDQRILQVWFAGAHSDVGGGYPRENLSYVSLLFMIDRAEQSGLCFHRDAVEALRAKADVHGAAHDSRSGVAAYYRYAPRKVSLLSNDPYSKVAVARPKIHESVLARIKEQRTPYAPTALPPEYDVVRFDGSVVALDALRDDAGLPLYESSQEALARAGTEGDSPGAQERAWDRIFWRRILYFVTIGSTLYLLLFPNLFMSDEGRACEGRSCVISSLIESAGELLPSLVDRWILAFSAHPLAFLLGALVLGGSWGLSRFCSHVIANAAERAWAHVKQRGGPPAEPYRKSTVYAIRNAPVLSATYRAVARSVLPLLFALSLVVAALLGLNHVSFKVGSSLGLVCTGSATTRAVGDTAVSIDFAIRNACQPTGYRLEHGRKYVFALKETEPWHDTFIPVRHIDRGFTAASTWRIGWDVVLSLYAATPLKRQVGKPWLLPYGRIGAVGTDEFPLRPGLFTARTDGELFLFVNDVVLGWPGGSSPFYANNRGRADVMLWRVSTDYVDR